MTSTTTLERALKAISPRISMRNSKAPDEASGQWVTLSMELSSGRAMSVEVYGPEVRFGGSVERGASVNWPGIGTVELADTLDFADLLRAAVLVAVTLAGPTKKEA